MLERIFNWFTKGQAPPPDVLDEERGVDWDGLRKQYEQVEWKETENMSLEEMMKAEEESRRTSPIYDFLPGNIWYGISDD